MMTNCQFLVGFYKYIVVIEKTKNERKLQQDVNTFLEMADEGFDKFCHLEIDVRHKGNKMN